MRQENRPAGQPAESICLVGVVGRITGGRITLQPRVWKKIPSRLRYVKSGEIFREWGKETADLPETQI
jgi:hypothetical protein